MWQCGLLSKTPDVAVWIAVDDTRCGSVDCCARHQMWQCGLLWMTPDVEVWIAVDETSSHFATHVFPYFQAEGGNVSVCLSICPVF
jgi:hypothetical protein